MQRKYSRCPDGRIQVSFGQLPKKQPAIFASRTLGKVLKAILEES